MNQITIHGRITATPEIRYTQAAEPIEVATFDVAVNRKFKKNEADFFRCVAFKKTAEMIEKYFSKGQEIIVEGSMQCRPYEKDGKKFYPWNLIANSIEFCGSKDSSESTQQKQANPSIENEGFYPIDESLENSDDLPF